MTGYAARKEQVSPLHIEKNHSAGCGRSQMGGHGSARICTDNLHDLYPY